MISRSTPEYIELGIESTGIIFHSISDIHEKYYVRAVEVTLLFYI